MSPNSKILRNTGAVLAHGCLQGCLAVLISFGAILCAMGAFIRVGTTFFNAWVFRQMCRLLMLSGRHATGLPYAEVDADVRVTHARFVDARKHDVNVANADEWGSESSGVSGGNLPRGQA